MDHVILVDENDRETGTMEKMEAHLRGKLHRAFSVLLFNSKGEALIQKRAAGKYHSAGLWTNTCCSHPLPNEPVAKAVRRRLKEEMGINAQPRFAYSFIYKTQLDGGITEHELDHIFIGRFDGEPEVNPTEAETWKYISMPALRQEVSRHPENFTYWFRRILGHRILLGKG